MHTTSSKLINRNLLYFIIVTFGQQTLLTIHYQIFVRRSIEANIYSISLGAYYQVQRVLISSDLSSIGIMICIVNFWVGEREATRYTEKHLGICKNNPLYTTSEFFQPTRPYSILIQPNRIHNRCPRSDILFLDNIPACMAFEAYTRMFTTMVLSKGSCDNPKCGVLKSSSKIYPVRVESNHTWNVSPTLIRPCVYVKCWYIKYYALFY
ncbi:hypothetical protein F4781DRAFT_395156 [Annulohypoxylon bovei var. microspora]|nr:hypothetical protein F4781DRAFT_395156 [Annulohypoxylon bovei var. microspora]